MKKLLPLLLLVAALPTWAYTLSGRVIEKSSGEPLPLATFHIYLPGDTLHPVVNDVTDTDGRLSTPLSDGKYRLVVEYLAKQPYVTQFSIHGADLNLGDISLEDADNVLDEVVVVSRKDLISSDGAKLTYDVERDPSAGTSTIIEMLRKVPMVTVDGQDNIKVKGQSNFKIYINGKPDPLLSGDPSTVLKSMPASSIKKIEVISDPGAKYDAEGVAGIINIVMDKKQSVEGYTASARVGLYTGGLNGSLYGRTKINKVTASATIYGFDGDFLRAHSYTTVHRTDFTNDTSHEYVQHSKSKSKNANIGGDVNFSWEADSLNLVTFSLHFNNGKYNSYVTQSADMYDIAGITTWSYDRYFKTTNGWFEFTPYLSYQHTFGNNPLHTLTFSYKLYHGRQHYDADEHNTDLFNVADSFEPWMLTANKWRQDEHTFQLDYSLPITDKQTFEAGAKVLIRQPEGDTQYSSGDDRDNQTITSLYHITQLNDLYAAYATYSATFGRFSIRAGVRWEHARLGMRYRRQLNTDYPDFTTHLNDFVPDASVSFKITDGSALRAAYSMRIERPGFNQLSPAVNNLTYGSMTYGNPDLSTAHANRFELKYTNYGGKFSGEASVSYSRTNDDVNSMSFMENGVEHTTYANIGSSEIVFGSGYLAYQITNTMDCSVSLWSQYSDSRADKGLVPLHSHGWNWGTNANYSYTTPFKLRVDAWGGYSSGWRWAQSVSSDYYYWGISISRSFLKNDMLTIAANFNDLFPARWESKNTTTTPHSVSTTVSNMRNWTIGLTLSVRFGSLRSDVKKTRANINNNDAAGNHGTSGK